MPMTLARRCMETTLLSVRHSKTPELWV